MADYYHCNNCDNYADDIISEKEKVICENCDETMIAVFSELLLSDFHGIYIPKVFVESFDLEKWNLKLDKEEKEILNNPENESYWDSWNDVLNNAELIDKDKNKYFLHQDGDLFAKCYVEFKG